MKINRIILKGVNNFENLDLTFKDEWTGTIPYSLLLMGINGSGKTTILEAISNLWLMFGNGLLLHGRDSTGVTAMVSNMYGDCHLVALEIVDFLSDLGKSIWICVGDEPDVEQLIAQNKSCVFFILASHTYRENGRKTLGNQFSKIVLPTPNTSIEEILETLNARFVNNILGGQVDLPNIVSLPSEQRYIERVSTKEEITPEQDNYLFVASYQTATKRKNSIQNYLFTLKAIDESKYKQIIDEANQFLVGKNLTGFDKRTRELMVTTNSGKSHPVHLLSSGEKQVLLMIAYITRHLRVGGIVLIDEPGLHLHTSLSTAFVSFISRMVSEQQGQLILASHDTDVWQYFSTSQRINLNEV